MTTRATEEKKKRSRKLVYDDYVGRQRIQETTSGATIVLGSTSGGGSGFRPELPPRERAEARFSLAEDTDASGSVTTLDDVKEKAADVWAKHKSAILFGAAALVLIAIVRKR